MKIVKVSHGKGHTYWDVVLNGIAVGRYMRKSEAQEFVDTMAHALQGKPA